MDNLPDNVLVSRVKLAALIRAAQWLKRLERVREGFFDDNDTFEMYVRERPDALKDMFLALDMPDFIESERDVEVVADAILVSIGENPSEIREYATRADNPLVYPQHTLGLVNKASQAAINALRYSKDGE